MHVSVHHLRLEFSSREERIWRTDTAVLVPYDGSGGASDLGGSAGDAFSVPECRLMDWIRPHDHDHD